MYDYEKIDINIKNIIKDKISLLDVDNVYFILCDKTCSLDIFNGDHNYSNLYNILFLFKIKIKSDNDIYRLDNYIVESLRNKYGFRCINIEEDIIEYDDDILELFSRDKYYNYFLLYKKKYIY